MRFIESRSDFPVSSAVLYYPNHLFETVLTAIPKGERKPVAGGAQAQMREIFQQLDRELYSVGADRTHIVSVKLHLKNLKRDLAAVDKVYAEYFGAHCPNRGVYGVDLQPGILIEAEFVATVPVYQ
jgi:enamine deaminase RidA (YjgF/YER057c/UK114 family)